MEKQADGTVPLRVSVRDPHDGMFHNEVLEFASEEEYYTEMKKIMANARARNRKKSEMKKMAAIQTRKETGLSYSKFIRKLKKLGKVKIKNADSEYIEIKAGQTKIRCAFWEDGYYVKEVRLSGSLCSLCRIAKIP